MLDSKFLKRLEQLSLQTRRPFAGRIRGERRSTKRGESVEFADFREYTAGDDFRRIDWNAYARLEELVIKLYLEEEDLLVVFLVDASASMGFGDPQKLDYAKRAAAALSYIALAKHDRVRLAPFRAGECRPTGLIRGKAKLFELFREMEGWNAEGETGFNDAAKRLLEHHRQGGIVVVLSDFLDPQGYREGLTRLAYSRFQVDAVQILSPQEANPGLEGDLRLVDSESDASVDLSMSRRVRKLYDKRFRSFCANLDTFCKKNEIGLTRALTTDPFEDLLLKRLRRSGLVK